jgi:hypothetical protein
VKNCLYEECLLAIKCCDVRDVFLLRTVHDDRMAEIQESSTAPEKNKPKAVTVYNKHKIGADKSNQLLSKSMKLWKTLFFYFSDLSSTNTHTLH